MSPRSHLSAHCIWNRCIQGKVLTCSPRTKGSKQIAHSGVADTADTSSGGGTNSDTTVSSCTWSHSGISGGGGLGAGGGGRGSAPIPTTAAEAGATAGGSGGGGWIHPPGSHHPWGRVALSSIHLESPDGGE